LEFRRARQHFYPQENSMSTDILSDVKSFRTLEDAIGWVLARKPAGEVIDVVKQDEYTLDVVVRLTPDTFLVFDTT
jgi:hypothetical protein